MLGSREAKREGQREAGVSGMEPPAEAAPGAETAMGRWESST